MPQNKIITEQCIATTFIYALIGWKIAFKKVHTNLILVNRGRKSAAHVAARFHDCILAAAKSSQLILSVTRFAGGSKF